MLPVQGCPKTYPLWDMTRDWMPKRASVVKPEAVSSLAMTTRIPLYESTDRAYIGAMSFLSGTIDTR